MLSIQLMDSVNSGGGMDSNITSATSVKFRINHLLLIDDLSENNNTSLILCVSAQLLTNKAVREHNC